MNLKELLDDLSKAATPGAWNPAPKRLSIPLSNGQVAEGPLMGYLVGDQTTGDGMTVSLGSERVADHRFVAALVNAYRDGELSVRAEREESLADKSIGQLRHEINAREAEITRRPGS